jgi:hypothetical protein
LLLGSRGLAAIPIRFSEVFDMSRRLTLGQERRAWARFTETGEADPRSGRNKFNAERKEVNGRIYDSTGESDRAVELQWLLQLGKLSELKYQVRFEIIPKQPGEQAAYYVADFTYIDEDGSYVVEDMKGHRTAVYLLKRKLMLQVHGIRIYETSPPKRSPKPRRQKRKR